MKKRMKRWAAGFLAAAIPLAGCQAGTQGSYESLTQVELPAGIGADDWEKQMKVREENPLSEAFLESVNQFSYATAARILSENADTENRNYSPISLYYALALTAQGAEGDTAEEFRELLGMEDKEAFAGECARLFRRLYLDHDVSKLKLADSIWMQAGKAFKEDFLRTAGEDFYASMFQADFADPKTGKAMGQWIADQTNGTLSPEFEPNEDERMAIVNTIYLYDEWSEPFDEAFNTTDTFTLASGEAVTCEYMNREFDFSAYYEGEGYRGTALRLKNTGSLVLILPDEGVKIQELLTENTLKDMFENREREYVPVDVSLPKFAFGDSMELAEPLKELGMDRAFAPLEADFSGMTKEQIYISRIRQETHIGINEDGAEASAYTVVEMEAGAAETMSEVYELKYDRPFLFGIVSDAGIPLFLGICNVPE